MVQSVAGIVGSVLVPPLGTALAWQAGGRGIWVGPTVPIGACVGGGGRNVAVGASVCALVVGVEAQPTSKRLPVSRKSKPTREDWNEII